MKKIGVQNLGMIVTNKCNLDCRHCERGCKNNLSISSEVIKATLDQIAYIGNLALCGGEITLALDKLEEIFNYIVDGRSVLVDKVTCIINGTNYSEEFLRLLNYIHEYIAFSKRKYQVYFNISYDEYHLEEIKKLNLLEEYKMNILKYSESHFFGTLQGLEFGKLFREGNAEVLSDDLTVPLRPMQVYLTYPSKFKTMDKKRKFCNIGPLVTVNTEGIITEGDASIEHQNTIYNYGNVIDDNIEDVLLNRGTVVVPRKWLKLTHQEITRFNTYQK